jgi:modification methylase
LFQENTFDVSDRRRQAPRVAFYTLLEYGLVSPGQPLFFKPKPSLIAHFVRMQPEHGRMVGSIHTLGKQLLNGAPCNGWDNWLYMYKMGLRWTQTC